MDVTTHDRYTIRERLATLYLIVSVPITSTSNPLFRWSTSSKLIYLVYIFGSSSFLGMKKTPSAPTGELRVLSIF